MGRQNFGVVVIMVSRIIIFSAAVFLVARAFSIDPFKIDKRWERFKKAYNKTYPSDSEEARRHAIWKNNTVLIMEHNKLFHANKTTFRLGMNTYADMTAKEFAARFNGFRKKHPNSHAPWREHTSRQRVSWSPSLSRTWWTAASLRAIWAVMEDLWTRLSTTLLSTRALTLKLPTNTPQWMALASSTLQTLVPLSSLGLMWLQAVNLICRRQWQQWDQ